MKAIKILDKLPIVLTKDPLYKPRTVATAGAIILLPDDAVLVKAENSTVEDVKVLNDKETEALLK